MQSNFSFRGSILGFERLDMFSFNLIPDTAFYQLQSLEEKDIQFVVINPFDWMTKYEVELTEQVITELELQEPNDALVLNIVTLRTPFSNSTVNYSAPLILNVVNGRALQHVIQGKKTYSSRSPFLMNFSEEGN